MGAGFGMTNPEDSSMGLHNLNGDDSSMSIGKLEPRTFRGTSGGIDDSELTIGNIPGANPPVKKATLNAKKKDKKNKDKKKKKKRASSSEKEDKDKELGKGLKTSKRLNTGEGLTEMS